MVTSDLHTGRELGRTHWSGEDPELLDKHISVNTWSIPTLAPGPGTLTLSSLAARVHHSVLKYNNLFKRKAGPAHYNTEDVELFEVRANTCNGFMQANFS